MCDNQAIFVGTKCELSFLKDPLSFVVLVVKDQLLCKHKICLSRSEVLVDQSGSRLQVQTIVCTQPVQKMVPKKLPEHNAEARLMYYGGPVTKCKAEKGGQSAGEKGFSL